MVLVLKSILTGLVDEMHPLLSTRMTLMLLNSGTLCLCSLTGMNHCYYSNVYIYTQILRVLHFSASFVIVFYTCFCPFFCIGRYTVMCIVCSNTWV